MNWIRNQNIVWEEIDGSALLVDNSSGERWRLNAAAAAAWKLCDGTHSVGDLSRILLRTRAEIIQFIQQIAAQRLLVTPLTLQPVCMNASQSSYFSVQSMGLGTGPRRRPTPRGVSGPG